MSLAGPSYEARMMSVQMMEQLKATARANVTICVFDTGNYHQPTKMVFHGIQPLKVMFFKIV